MKSKKILNYFGFFIFFIFVGYAINTVATGYKVNDNLETSVDAHGTCQKVKNNNCEGVGIFVPTKTSAEWTSFRTNKPSCVTLSGCAPGDCAPNNIYNQWGNDGDYADDGGGQGCIEVYFCDGDTWVMDYYDDRNCYD